MSLKLWKLPRNYTGDEWPEYYVFLTKTRDSDCLEISNFRTALKKLGGESETVFSVRESHFLCGWVEWIAVHASDTSALKLAEEMQERIESCLVLGENDWGELEHETADKVWKNFSDSERIEYVKKHRSQFEFSDFADMLGCCRGKYFAGGNSKLIY